MIQRMVTLTEFLLARITEDEAGIKAGTIQNGVFSGIMRHYGMDETDADDQAEASEIAAAVMAYLQPRVLAECEAKRRIVSMGSEWLDEDSGGELLKLLALPYADHPAYQPEWKV